MEVFIPNTEKSSIEVFDMIGKKIKTITLKNTIGIKKVSLDLTKEASGEYILFFKINNKTIRKILLKQ